MATTAIASAKRFQWESNSAPSQSWNCGPTCATQIAQFYRDRWFGIEATRRLVVGPGVATSGQQQAVMLQRRGVPAAARYLNSIAELHSLVGTHGRRPVILGIQMSRVSLAYRDHSFTGWHAVVVLQTGYINGARGFWVTDPNFSPVGGWRADPDRGKKWYPDWVMQSAWANNSPRWAVVPAYLKALPAPPPATSTKGRGRVATPSGSNVCNIRTSASLNGAIYARARSDGNTYRYSDNRKLWANSSAYIFWGWKGDWANVTTGSGMRLYIHRAVFIVTVKP